MGLGMGMGRGPRNGFPTDTYGLMYEPPDDISAYRTVWHLYLSDVERLWV